MKPTILHSKDSGLHPLTTHPASARALSGLVNSSAALRAHTAVLFVVVVVGKGGGRSFIFYAVFLL